MPAEQFDDRRYLDLVSTIQLITGANPVEENVPCESLGTGNWNSRGSSDRMPVAQLALQREPAGKAFVQQQGRFHAVVVCPQPLRGVAGGKIALELERDIGAL